MLLVSSHVIAAEEVPRTITLKEIAYKSATDWEITLNDQKITAQSAHPPEVMDLQVSSDTVRIKWFDKKLDGVLDVKLAPFQTYDVESGVIERVRIPPPSGMTEEEWKWVETAITTSMTLSRNHYQSELQASSKNFTQKGWEQFTKSIVKNGFLGGKENFKITASLKSPPSLIQANETAGNQTWLFSVTLYIDYSIESERRIMRTNLQILIERSPVNPAGLAISGWASTPPLKK